MDSDPAAPKALNGPVLFARALVLGRENGDGLTAARALPAIGTADSLLAEATGFVETFYQEIKQH